MWSRIVGIAVVVLLVAGAAWALWPRPLAVEEAIIGRQDLTVTVDEEGVSQIREVFRVSSPIAGRMGRVGLHVGDAVLAGEVLASIYPVSPGLLDERSRRMAEAAEASARAAVELADANLAQAKAQFDYASAQLERKLQLAQKALISAEAEQQAKLEAATANQSVAAAKATLLMRQQELASAQAALTEGEGLSGTGPCCVELRAPAAGRVLQVLAESEQVVQPGTPVLEVGDPADLEIDVDVLSSDAVRLAVGAKASIERWGGEPLRAMVQRIDPVAVTRVSALGIEEQRTRVVLDLIDGADLRRQLGHGFRVVARIEVWRGENLVVVPLGALFRRGEDFAVFVADDGVARIRTVAIGQRSDAYAQVLDGLAPGDVVIIHPSDVLEDGRSITSGREEASAL